MATINRFEDLKIWKLSRELCNEVYHIIESTNLKNNFKLCNQIDGSSGSVMDILLKDCEIFVRRNQITIVSGFRKKFYFAGKI